MVERGTHNSLVTGSSPVTSISIIFITHYLATCTNQTPDWICINESYLVAFAQKADELNVLYYFCLDLTPPSPGHQMGMLASVTTCYPKSMSKEQQQKLQEQFDLIKGIFSEN